MMKTKATATECAGRIAGPTFNRVHFTSIIAEELHGERIVHKNFLMDMTSLVRQ